MIQMIIKMETKHTPGAWKIKINALGIMLFIIGKTRSKWKSVCKLDLIDDYPDTQEEAESNAKLIEAAPELLEHLTALLIVAEVAGISGEGIDEAKQLVKKINS